MMTITNYTRWKCNAVSCYDHCVSCYDHCVSSTSMRSSVHPLCTHHPSSEDDDLAQLTELPTALRDEVVAFLTKDVLEHSPIFGVLGKHERRYLARRMVPLTLPMGHDLFREGDDAESMYILQEGM